MKLLVFPGNPGRQYEKTRHNLPWMVLDTFLEGRNLPWKTKFNARWCSLQEGGEKTVLLKPRTFMNLTGKSVQSAAAFFKIPAGQIMVLHDDLELNFGFLSIKKGGGTGGHNGLRSITSSLGSKDFYRLRMGISRPARQAPASYVLDRFSREEEAELPDLLNAASKILDLWITKEAVSLEERFSKCHYSGV